MIGPSKHLLQLNHKAQQSSVSSLRKQKSSKILKRGLVGCFLVSHTTARSHLSHPYTPLKQNRREWNRADPPVFSYFVFLNTNNFYGEVSREPEELPVTLTFLTPHPPQRNEVTTSHPCPPSWRRESIHSSPGWQRKEEACTEPGLRPREPLVTPAGSGTWRVQRWAFLWTRGLTKL